MMTELSSLLSSLRDLGSKELSILLSSHSPSVLIRPMDGVSQEHLIDLPDNDIFEVLEVLAPLGKDFRSVTLISCVKEVTFVPDGLYESSRSKSYLDAVFGEVRKAAIHVEHVPALSLHYVFRLEERLLDQIRSCFPQGHIRHLCESMMIETWANQRHGEEFVLRMHQQNSDLFMMAFKGKQLELSTHHHIGEPTDIVYHSLHSINSFGIDFESAKVLCSGALHPKSEALMLLTAYCPLSEFISAEFSTISAPEQFILSSQSYCES